MPDQPDDPIHYEMKIPPEPKDATLNKEREKSGSDEVTSESDKLERAHEEDGDKGAPRATGR